MGYIESRNEIWWNWKDSAKPVAFSANSFGALLVAVLVLLVGLKLTLLAQISLEAVNYFSSQTPYGDADECSQTQKGALRMQILSVLLLLGTTIGTTTELTPRPPIGGQICWPVIPPENVRTILARD